MRAIQLQAQWGETQIFLLGTVEQGMKDKSKPIPREEDDHDDTRVDAWDDMSGEQLNGKAVVGARKEEIKYYHQMDAFEVVPTQVALDRAGNNPIGVRWLDVNERDESRPGLASLKWKAACFTS